MIVCGAPSWAHLTSVVSINSLLLNLCWESSDCILLRLPHKRNHARHYCTLLVWFLQWLQPVMQQFLSTEDSAKLLGMVAPSNAVRSDSFPLFGFDFCLFCFPIWLIGIWPCGSCFCRVLNRRLLDMLKMALLLQGLLSASKVMEVVLILYFRN